MKKKILFLIPTLGHGGAEKVLVNLVNNLDKSKFDITVQTIFDDGVNKDFLKKHIRYIYTMKKTFRGFSHLLKLFTTKQLHRMLIKETYDIEVAFLEAVCTRIISGCNNQNTVLISEYMKIIDPDTVYRNDFPTIPPDHAFPVPCFCR